jgi:hypothetical protein
MLFKHSRNVPSRAGRTIAMLVSGTCLIGVGAWLVSLGGETEFTLLGQSLKTESVGPVVFYSGIVFLILSIRKKYVDKPDAI